ncbi:rhodanese-like domain-containing protein [Arcanobacterium buesumense]|uniref:Rhodanese domain-containing protein n=1 Tax=Arcanobacterium buesumense TaxID=2722751 RepID=A0A6H2EKD2_9ACTO|nr:rhodanese-like domain-containing protein [Arcanobacterium buesumense]QJC21634.1 hypothetical protein HC352_03345 [Arcanobacterium buesumense]
MGFFDFIFPNGKSPQITTAQAMQEHADGVRIIDIRDIIEWNKGHIPTSEHIPQAKLMRPDSGLTTNERLILVCSNGVRSLSAAERMRRSGFDVTSVHGGLDSWKRSGFPFDK